MLGDDTDTPAGQTLLTTNSSIAYIAAAHSSGGTKILIINRREPGKGQTGSIGRALAMIKCYLSTYMENLTVEHTEQDVD